MHSAVVSEQLARLKSLTKENINERSNTKTKKHQGIRQRESLASENTRQEMATFTDLQYKEKSVHKNKTGVSYQTTIAVRSCTQTAALMLRETPGRKQALRGVRW